MTEPGSRLERFFERAAALGASPALHPSRLFHEVSEAARASRRDGSIANAYRITVSARDGTFFAEHYEQMEMEIRELLGEIESELRASPPAPWIVDFVETDDAPTGSIAVVASFRNPNAVGDQGPATAAVTRAIRRHRGRYLVVEGYGRVPLTHTPFVIGRGRDCDLAIPDLSISRRHAEIDSLPDGRLVLRDLGSRNQLSVHGGKLAEVTLTPGLVIGIGGSKLWLEQAE
jgi:hypothetical protein